MVIRIFKKPPSFNETLNDTIHRLNVEKKRVEQYINRFNERCRNLLETCGSALIRGQKERAAIYANEIAEVRKLIKTMESTHLSIEQAILRLETIREMEGITTEVKAMLSETQSVIRKAGAVIPEIKDNIGELSKVVEEIIGNTSLSSTPPITATVVKDAYTEKILEESMKEVEKQMLERIPEPPSTAVVEPVESKQRIAVLASPIGIANPVKEKYETHNELLERWVLDYARKNRNVFDVSKCAAELNVPTNEVLEALDALHARGKIRIVQ